MKVTALKYAVSCFANDGNGWSSIIRRDFEIPGEFDTAAEATEAISQKIEALEGDIFDEVVYADSSTAILIHDGDWENDEPNLMYMVRPILVKVPE